MTIYKKWDIILVPFPFTDLSSTKKRPALVVLPDRYNETGDLVLAFITSNIQSEEKFGDYRIEYWQQAGLPLPSRFRMKFATINTSIVVKKIGTICAIDQEALQKSILFFFS